jgi:hypothetical protein
MSQKTMLAVAASLTAFVLVLVGGVFGRVTNVQAASAQATSAAISPAMADLWNQRESAYRALIDEANQRLQAAASPTPQPTAAATDPAAAITPDQAANLAIVASRGASILKAPELVDFQGTVAYEVQTSAGLVYIDAANGSVLYNGTVHQVIVRTRHGGGDDEHEHESGGDD